MKNKKSFGYHIKIICTILFFSVLFFISAQEDHSFKKWKQEYMGLYKSYSDVEYYCFSNQKISQKSIIILSDLKGLYTPFYDKILGNLRRYVYHRLVPDIKKVKMLVKENDPGVRIVRRGLKYGFRPSFKPSNEDLSKIDIYDLDQVNSFMSNNGIEFIILPYYKKGWSQLLISMKEKNFLFLYGNSHFMLFGLKGPKKTSI